MFRYALCNEVYGARPFAETCRALRAAGYDGVEIAPFTLPEGANACELRAAIEGEGLAFAGLHWLLAAPAGLHATTPDDAVRQRTWDHVRRLIELCAVLGEGGVMVFGSPKQRSGPADARRRLVEGLAAVAPEAEARGVAILLEAIPANQGNTVVRTLAEAADVVREVGSPAVQSMFDTHNTADETDGAAELIERHFDMIRHVHLNEMDGRHPGAGDYDFRSALEALKRRSYRGWLSVEVFDFETGPDAIARESIAYLKRHS